MQLATSSVPAATLLPLKIVRELLQSQVIAETPDELIVTSDSAPRLMLMHSSAQHRIAKVLALNKFYDRGTAHKAALNNAHQS
jgi:hypothetical protein